MLWGRKTEVVCLSCVNSRDDVGVVLELIKVCISGCAGLREGVREERVIWTVGQCIHDMGEVKFWTVLVSCCLRRV